MTELLSEIYKFQRVKMGIGNKLNIKITGKMSSGSDYELPTKIKIDKYFRFYNFQTGFGVYSFSRLNDFSGGGFFNRKTFCDRSYARTGSLF